MFSYCLIKNFMRIVPNCKQANIVSQLKLQENILAASIITYIWPSKINRFDIKLWKPHRKIVHNFANIHDCVSKMKNSKIINGTTTLLSYLHQHY